MSTQTRICMTCNARITAPWEHGTSQVDEMVRAAGWLLLQPREGRAHGADVCLDCAKEIAAIVGRLP